MKILFENGETKPKNCDECPVRMNENGTNSAIECGNSYQNCPIVATLTRPSLPSDARIKPALQILDENGFDYDAFAYENEYSAKNLLAAMEEYALQYRIGQTPASGWIPVSERLPDENCDVLVAKTNGMIVQMSFHAPLDTGKRIFQWWGFGEWINQHRQVTHWMPLPASPEKGGQQ